MLDALDFIGLKEQRSLPETRFFDWDDEAKDILIGAWVENMCPIDRDQLYDEVGIKYFNTSLPYYRFLSDEEKNKLYSALEERLINLVDEVNQNDLVFYNEDQYAYKTW